MSINAKKKGNKGENNWANWLIDNGIKAWRDTQSGGGTREKADVGNDINAHFEVKTVKKLSLDKVWKKAKLECQKTHNTPYVIIHFDGMPKDEWIVCLSNWDWLDLVKGEKEINTNYVDPQEVRNKKYNLDQLIRSAKQVIKDYD